MFYILRIKISWYFYRLIVKSMLFYLKWAESSQFMAYRNEWTGLFSLFYVRFLTTADSHALVFKALGFCRIGSLAPTTNESGAPSFLLAIK